jgi:inositol 1,4,5-triphosphate receptor type 1
VIPISPIVSDIIKSVTNRAQALGLVFYLFCISVFIYVSFGMTHFKSDFIVPIEADAQGKGEDYEQCESMLQCFYMLFYVALQEGGKIKFFLTSVLAGQEEFPMRIVYDSLFFVWVGIIMNNIITGLIVDSFGSIREEKKTRYSTFANDCFVCGIHRNSYEDLSVGTEVRERKRDRINVFF